MSDSKPPVDRALDVLVFGPLGVALYTRDLVPGFFNMFVTRGRSEIDRRRRGLGQQIGNARTIGRFAVGYGAPRVRSKVEQGLGGVRSRAEETVATLTVLRGGAPQPAPPTTTNGPAPNGKSAHASASHPAGSATHLAIPDYDELAASQVVPRLEGLGRAELDEVREYEAAHRNRRTVLAKIDQLSR